MQNQQSEDHRRTRSTHWGVYVLAVLFTVTGLSHFVIPGYFEAIVPPWLPNPPLLVVISGVAEVAGAIGLVPNRTRRWAGWGLIALLIAVFPANIYAWQAARAHGESATRVFVLLLRLPVQLLLVWWVWSSAVRRVELT